MEDRRFEDGTIKKTQLYGGGELTVWRVWDMSLVFQFSSLAYIEAVEWSSDGRYLFIGGRDDGQGRMQVFSTSGWQMIGTRKSCQMVPALNMSMCMVILWRLQARMDIYFCSGLKA